MPGSGLGRLPFELALRGFDAQGNEWSYFMLLGSQFVLNTVGAVDAVEIHPYCTTRCNVVRADHVTEAVRFPDVVPRSLLSTKGSISMAAGGFLESYADDEAEWDAVVTCFFLDTAANVFDYLDCIARILKPGGHWINLGPLLYHYSGRPDETSIELAADELMRAIGLHGAFDVVEHAPVTADYTNDGGSLARHAFECIFFTATRK